MRSDDEKLYEIALQELEANAPRKGLFAKAFAEAMGDAAKTKALYLKLRVAQLKERETEPVAGCRAALDSPAQCVKALREMGCSVGADATRSWTIVAPDGTPTRVFNFDGLQKHTLALRSRTTGRAGADAARVPPREAGEAEPVEATSGSRPASDTR